MVDSFSEVIFFISQQPTVISKQHTLSEIPFWTHHERLVDLYSEVVFFRSQLTTVISEPKALSEIPFLTHHELRPLY